nr:immunoglobulin heavy chain junction region [Mus musculus]
FLCKKGALLVLRC